jgi:signal transduction histidine kinase
MDRVAMSEDGDHHLMLSTTLQAVDGSVRGVVVALCEPLDQWGLSLTKTLPGQTLVFSDDGLLLSLGSPPTKPLLVESTIAPLGDGRSRWHIRRQVDGSAISSGQGQVTVLVLGGFLLGYGLLMVLTYALGRWLTRPLDVLRQKTEACATGDRQAFDDLPPGGSREAAVLAALAQSMAAALGRQVGDLDRRVAELVATREVVMEREAQFGAVLESMADGLALIEGRGHIVLSNSAFGSLVSCSGEEIGKPIGQVVPLEYEDGRVVLALDAVRPTDRLFLVVGETRLPVQLRTNPFLVGRSSWAVVSLTDMTQARRDERQLLQAHKMEALGRLTGSVVHDVNNMLSVVLGVSERLAGVDTDPAIKAMAGRLALIADRGAGLIQTLESFADGRSARNELLELAPMLERCHQLVLDAERRPPQAQVLLEAGPELWVSGDPSQLESAVMNLVFNAFDALPGGIGTVRIRATGTVPSAEWPARIDRTVSPSWLAIQVSDDGSGMDQATKDRLFETFFTTKGTGGGTGLGLAGVYSTIDRHGGWVDVDSGLGRGTTFSLILPAQALPASGASKATSGSDSIPASVLVVDDEAGIRMLLSDTLEEAGFAVSEAADGVEALEALHDAPRPFSIMLLDLRMPRIDGWQVLESIASGGPAPQAIAVFSSHLDQDDEHRLAAFGIRTFISKPFRLGQVLDFCQRSAEKVSASS